jgi:hypothetical protein
MVKAMALLFLPQWSLLPFLPSVLKTPLSSSFLEKFFSSTPLANFSYGGHCSTHYTWLGERCTCCSNDKEDIVEDKNGKKSVTISLLVQDQDPGQSWRSSPGKNLTAKGLRFSPASTLALFQKDWVKDKA